MQLAEKLLDQGTGPSEALDREELRRSGREAPERLDEQAREVLALRYLEQMPAREVAAVLGQGEAAVKKRALRALKKLRGMLENGTSEGGG